MPLLYIVGGLVAVGLMAYLVCSLKRALLMTATARSSRPLLVVLWYLPSAWRLHFPRVRKPPFGLKRALAGGAVLYRWSVRPDAEWAGRPTRRRC